MSGCDELCSAATEIALQDVYVDVGEPRRRQTIFTVNRANQISIGRQRKG